MLDFLNNMAGDAIGLARTVAVLIAVVTVGAVWMSTRALIPVLASILLAAIALFAISPQGVAWLQQRISDDATKTSSSAPATFHLPEQMTVEARQVA